MKIIKLTEQDLELIVKKVLNEQRALPTLSRGQKSDEIKQIQLALIEKGYDLGKTGPNKDGIDGDFGKRTQNAVKDFQKRMKLNPTGQIDQMTRNYLFMGSTVGIRPSFMDPRLQQQTPPPKKVTPPKSDERGKRGQTKQPEIEQTFLDCVKNSPKRKDEKYMNTNTPVIIIDGHMFFNNLRARRPDGTMGTYYCYENGVRIKDDTGKKTYVETGVKTVNVETSRFDGGLKGFLRKSFPNMAQIFFTRPLTEKDFTESQKQVVFNVIQNAVNKRGQNPRQGCTEYIDFNDEIDQQLNKNGGATTSEMILGTGLSDEFRVATTLGRFCYSLQGNGSYKVTDDYDFHKWKTFTVKPEEIAGMSYPEKIGYIMDKTGLSPYGAIRHIGYLEHPAEAPASTKTKIVLNINPGYYAKRKGETPTSGQSSDKMV